MRASMFFLVGATLAAGCGSAPTILVEPLSIVSFEPNQGAHCVAAEADAFDARLTFSDDLSSASLTNQTVFVRPTGGDPVAEVLSYDKATQTVRLTVGAALSYGTAYELVATIGIEGVASGRLSAPLMSTFMTIPSGGCFQ